MLNQTTYLNALTIAQELAEKSITIGARPSSVLGELVDLSVSSSTTKTTDLTGITVRSGNNNSLLLLTPEERACNVYSNTGDFCEQSQHSLKIQAMADDIAPFIVSHISFARNTVAPLVGELADKLTKFMETSRPLDPVGQFEIRERTIPELLLDESFMSDGLEAYEDLTVNFASFPNVLDVPGDDAFYQNLVNVGNERVNGLVAKWLLPLGLDYIKLVFTRTFSNQPYAPTTSTADITSGYLGDPGQYNNPYDSLDQALATYLIATRLMADVQSVKNMSLVEYKTAMRAVIDYAGSVIHKALRTAKRQINGNVIVSEAVISKKQLTVNKPVYKAWLTAGGKPEILLGMLVSGQIQYAVEGVNAIGDKLLRQWENFVMLSQASIKAEFQKRFACFIEAEALASLDNQSALEKEYAEGKMGLKAKIAESIKAELDCLGTHAMDDLHYTALIVVAKARFFYTSAFAILEQMMLVARENPNIDPREAALLSTITYLGEYFEEQITVKK